jgi:hypothetical protein
MSHHHHHHGHPRFGEDCGCNCGPGAAWQHHPHFHSSGCSPHGPRGGHHHPHSHSLCCSELAVERRYPSPEEQKEALVKYIDELKKELAGAEAELEKL